MDLFIEIDNGQPVNHPYLGQNLRNCGIDTDRLPPRFAPFVRTPCALVPAPGETVEHRYCWDAGVVRDEWYLSGIK